MPMPETEHGQVQSINVKLTAFLIAEHKHKNTTFPHGRARHVLDKIWCIRTGLQVRFEILNGGEGVEMYRT
jgi:hypothetical protein